MVQWRVLAAESLADGPWDWIFSSAMLQWAAEPTALFAEWRRHLAPGGRVLAGLFVEESLSELRGLLGGGSPLSWRTPESWRQCIADSGLRVVRDAVDRRVFRCESALALVRSLHATGTAPFRRVSAGRRRRLLRDYEDRHRDHAGVCATWTYYRFEAEQPRARIAR